MNIIDSASVYYAQPDGRKQVHKVGRVTRCSKKVWVQQSKEKVFNAVCKAIEKSERAQKQRDVRRAKR